MKVMISQPMNGKSNKQIRKERERIVEILETLGHEVIDTIIEEDVKLEEVGNIPIYFLGRTIELMAKADGVVFMEGWQETRGCIIEHLIAEKYGLWIKEW